jgi:alkylation response protein AidB-like acyl-CoA dehydrogenase
MDFRLTAEDLAWKDEVEEWFKNELPDGWMVFGGESIIGGEDEVNAFTRDFATKLGERGFLSLGWPKEYGGVELDFVKQAILKDVWTYYRAPFSGYNAGSELVAPILMMYGSPEQKEKYIPPIKSGHELWAQWFSEPDAGSDLANTQVTAVADGDDYVLNGVKVWHALLFDRSVLLARTDPDAPKHRGISFFCVDRNLPGITIEPLEDLAGGKVIGKTTFDNVRVPKSDLVGELNRGWYVAMATMNIERSNVSAPASARRSLDDTLAWAKTHTGPDGRKVIDNPIVRAKLAQTHIEIELGRTMAYNVAALSMSNNPPDKEASVTKMYGSELTQRVVRTITEVIGLYAPLEPGSKHAQLGGIFSKAYASTTVDTVALGSSEIMRNVIATRSLGLPRG